MYKKNKSIFGILLIFIYTVTILSGCINLEHKRVLYTERVKKSSLGDEFIIETKTVYMPNLEKPYTEDTIVIKDSKTMKEIVNCIINDNREYSDNPITIINLPELRCYEICSCLIYKVDNKKFNGIFIDDIVTKKPKRNKNLIKVAKILVETKEWNWITVFGEFLISSEDKEFKTLLEKFSIDEFTQEELAINKDSKYTRQDMIMYSKKLLNNQ